MYNSNVRESIRTIVVLFRVQQNDARIGLGSTCTGNECKATYGTSTAACGYQAIQLLRGVNCVEHARGLDPRISKLDYTFFSATYFSAAL
jgi:hypothetical protein